MIKTLQQIDRTLEESQGTGFRRHLGASVIGKECARQSWYIFRWAKRARFKARVLRLFDRGNREEPALAKLLRAAGIHVLLVNPETGEQFRIEDHEGHFGGSLDALIFDCPDFPMEWVLGEFKTHNDKSFKEVKKLGIKKAKPEYYAQAQVYMRKFGLRVCLHFNVNKNDDDIYIEIIYLDPTFADTLIDRAGKIIRSDTPPVRISENPGWYKCTFCDFNDICHAGMEMAKNCRTCIHSRPVEGAQWICSAFGNYSLTEQEQRKGCAHHSPIRE